jgi:hypothetical protein
MAPFNPQRLSPVFVSIWPIADDIAGLAEQRFLEIFGRKRGVFELAA